MRRRYVLALVLVTALIFALAGTAFGHYVVPRSKGDSGLCIYLRTLIEHPDQTSKLDKVVADYDTECR